LINQGLLDWLASCNKSPLRFVLGAFPWGEPKGSLERFKGPEPWQLKILVNVEAGLIDINNAIKIA
jgi:hypothetical protein